MLCLHVTLESIPLVSLWCFWSLGALLDKYYELQGDPKKRQRDIELKARVFEILTRIMQRLFGVSPHLFGR